MDFLKYPFGMKRKEKIEILDALIKNVSKIKVNCPICFYKYGKGEQGRSYSIPKVDNPEFYPQDYIEGCCPVCKIEKKKDKYYSHGITKEDLKLIKKIIIWRYKKVPKINLNVRKR